MFGVETRNIYVDETPVWGLNWGGMWVKVGIRLEDVE